MSAQKEHGIIFSSESIKAILNNTKTQTRRTWGLKEINKKPDDWMLIAVFQDGLARFASKDGKEALVRCPYGGYGDRLWVKETTWHYSGSETPHYAASEPPNKLSRHFGKIVPSIFLHRRHSRILLEITEVGAERLQAITEADAEAEGVICCPNAVPDYRHHFMILWDSLNAKRGYGWEKNNWVWPIRFKLVDSR